MDCADDCGTGAFCVWDLSLDTVLLNRLYFDELHGWYGLNDEAGRLLADERSGTHSFLICQMVQIFLRKSQGKKRSAENRQCGIPETVFPEQIKCCFDF